MVNINWAGEAFDIIASLAGKYGQWLNSRGKKFCFIIWSICMLYWSARDFNLGLYSQSVFCVFSLALNCYGYFNWKKQGIGETKKDLAPAEKISQVNHSDTKLDPSLLQR